MTAGPTPVPQPKPGDVVNGHVLTDQGRWVPSNQQPPHGGGQFASGRGGTLPSLPARSWYKKKRIIIPGVIVLLAIIGALGGGNDNSPQAGEPQQARQTQEETPTAEDIAAASAKAEEDRLAEEARVAEEAATSAAAAAEEAAAAELEAAEEAAAAAELAAAEEAAAAAAAAEEAARGTVSQQNAFDTATDYLAYTAFSRSGLIGQLEYEGFPAGDAEFAVARVEASGGVDWNAQAAASAASYLEYSSFSRSGLIGQLKYEGFSSEQAEYGVSTTGL